MRESLTRKQREVLDFIKQFIDENEYSPTIREICKGMCIGSTATVFTHLQNLKDKQYITYKDGKSRTIKIL